MSWAEAIAEIFKFFNNLFATPKSQIKKVVNIYDAMHRVVEETPVERFLIYKAHNSGGIIRPHTPLYISALYEDYTHPFESVKDDYQRLPMDEDALRILAELGVRKSMFLKTSELRDGMVKRIYEAEGVKYADLFYLGQDRRNLYFCSCASSKEVGWEHDSYVNNEINVCINQIRNNIR